MIDKTQWSRYIDATSDNAFNSAIAEATGVDPATVGRWRTGAVDPRPRQVVAYARAYKQSPIAALIAAGYLTEAEVGLSVSAPKAYTLDDFTALELAEELVQRLAAEDGYRIENRRGGPTIVNTEGGKLTPLNVGPTAEDEVTVKQPPARMRDAAMKGTRKADEAPHAE